MKASLPESKFDKKSESFILNYHPGVGVENPPEILSLP